MGYYVVNVHPVTDPGSSGNIALGQPKAGTIGSASDAEHDSLNLGGKSDAILLVKGVAATLPEIEVVGQRHVNAYIYPPDAFIIYDNFTGSPRPRVTAAVPGTYTVQALDDTVYTSFIQECTEATKSLDPSVGDDRYACQWRLEDRALGRKADDSPDDQDIYVGPVWADGNLGNYVHVAVVDDGIQASHPDLRSNVQRHLNWNYSSHGADKDGVDRPERHHGTALAGVIAARDNAIGVQGVAPKAEIYSHNLLAEPSDFSMVNSMTRNMGVTTNSNNSWRPIDGPGLSLAQTLWKRAVVRGVNEGNGGRDVFYTFAAGNGGPVGDGANLNRFANLYAVTSVCAVDDAGGMSDLSEAGPSLWLCAPSGNGRPGHRDIVTTENSDFTAGTSEAPPPHP